MLIIIEEHIDVGLLIRNNIKYMDDSPQRTRGNFSVISELWELVGVPIHMEV